MNTYFAVDIGGTFTKFAVMDDNALVISRGKIPTQKESQDAFVDMLENLYQKYGQGTSGMAISSAGVIDSERGYMHNAGAIACVKDLDLAAELERRIGVPVSVENDARSAAMAELWKGSLTGCRNAVVMVIGTAVGGAVIADGHILHGSHQMAGEFSYFLTNAQDPENPENALGSTGGMPALIRMCAQTAGIPEEGLSGEMIFDKANAGDTTYLACVRRFARGLAVHIMNCQFAYDPEKTAIGGGVSAQPLLISLIREELEKLSRVYLHPVPVPEVTTCRFFNDSNLIGALYVLLKQEAAK